MPPKARPEPARGYTPDPAETGQRFTPDGMGGGRVYVEGVLVTAVIRKEPHRA